MLMDSLRHRVQWVASVGLLLVGLAAENLQAITPVYVRADGSDTVCDGSADAGLGATPTCAVRTVGMALSLVDPGGTILVGAGTFDEPAQVVISSTVTITGAGAGATLFTLSFDTGTSGDPRGWFLVDATGSLTLSGVTLDGAGQLVWQAIRDIGTGSSISDCAFRNIGYNPSGPHYQGTAVAAFGTGPVDVTDCTFTNIGRVHVHYFGAGISGATASGNTHTGKGVGDFLDYAYCIGGGAGSASPVVVTGASIANHKGVASVDGSTSAGVLVSTFFDSGTTATIEDSTIVDCTTGVFQGFDSSDTSTVSVSGCLLHDNRAGIRSLPPGTAASLTVSENCILENAVGLDFGAAATVPASAITDNNIERNNVGAFYDGTGLVVLDDNWWGAADGPSGDGAVREIPSTGPAAVARSTSRRSLQCRPARRASVPRRIAHRPRRSSSNRPTSTSRR